MLPLLLLLLPFELFYNKCFQHNSSSPLQTNAYNFALLSPHSPLQNPL